MYKGIDLHTHLEGGVPPMYYKLSSQQELTFRKLFNTICGLEDFSHIFGLLSRTIKNEEDYEIITKNFFDTAKRKWCFLYGI